MAAAAVGDIIELAPGAYEFAAGDQIAVGLTMRGSTGNPDDVVVGCAALADGIIAGASFQGQDGLLFSGMTFRDFDATAALLGHSWDLTVSHCRFIANGGLTLVGANGELSLQDCHFQQNQSSQLVASNGGLSIADGVFQDNSVTAIISVEFGDITMTRTSMTGNSGVWLRMPPGGDVQISSCLFQDNSSSSAGIQMLGGGNLNMMDCTVRSNVCPEGAVFVGAATQASLTQCDVLGNGDLDGSLVGGSNSIFTCCDVDLYNWQINAAYTLDNEGCLVGSQPATLGGLKALFHQGS